MPDGTPRRRFNYRQRTPEDVERHRQRYRVGIGGLAVKANDGEPDEFINFVCSDPRLSDDEQAQDSFRWLLEKTLCKVPAHRPRGLLEPKNAAIKFAAHLVEVAARVFCDRYRRRRATHQGLREYWRLNAIALAAQAFPEVPEITDDELKTYKRDRRQHVTEFVDYDTVVKSEFVMTEMACWACSPP
jgi:hypothetical protein